MGARTSNKHTDSGGLDVCLTKRNSNIKSLTKSGFVPLIDINDRINFKVVDSSDYLISELADRDNKSFRNFRISKLSIHFNLDSKNIHGLFKGVLLFTVDAVNHVEFR